jgi:hypothetical protein
MIDFSQKFVVIATTVLSFTSLEASSTLAAAINTYRFTVDISSGSLQGNQYNGFFRFENVALPPDFTGSLFGLITDFEFSFINSAIALTTYTEDDLSVAGVFFSNGLFSGLEIEAREGLDVFFEINSEPIADPEFFYNFLPLPTTQFGFGSVTYNSLRETVSEPTSSLSLLVLGFLGAGLTFKRFQKRNSVN